MKFNPSPFKRVLVLAVANVVMFLLVFLIGEFALRWYVGGGPWVAVLETFLGQADRWLIHDDELGYKLNSKLDEVNSLGIRHTEITPGKPNDLFRIVVIGDSVAWDKNGFVTLLRERSDRLRDGQIEVINAAIPGYTTYQERRLLERDLLPLNPDLVILQYCLNDNHRFLHLLNKAGNWLITAEAKRALIPEGDGWLTRLGRSSYLLFEVRRSMLKLKLRQRSTFPWENSAEVFPAWQDRTWPVFKEHLLAMRESTMRVGAKFAVVVIPYKPQLRQELLDLDKAYTLKPQRTLLQIALEAQVPVLDLYPVFLAERDRSLYTDRIHLTSDGHELVWQELSNFIEQEGLVVR